MWKAVNKLKNQKFIKNENYLKSQIGKKQKRRR